MKKLFGLLLLSTVLFSCRNVEMFELSNGKYITKRKSDRIAKKVIRKELKKLSKKEKESVYMIKVDTNN